MTSTVDRPMYHMRTAVLIAFAAGAVPSLLAAQEPPPTPVVGPTLGSFAAQRVAVVPVQLWRADSIGWSRSVVWTSARAALDSAIQAEFMARGQGRKWAYAADVVRAAKRNPTFASDPYSLGVARWRGVPPQLGELVPHVLADNLRPVTALGDARYALIPVELRAVGDGVSLRLVLVDTRARHVTWFADVSAPGGAAMVSEVAHRVVSLVLDP